MRLLQIVVPSDRADTTEAILEETDPSQRWKQPLADDRVLFTALIAKEKVEPFMDAVESRLGTADGVQLMLVPVEATYPRQEEVDDQPGAEEEAAGDRISREELYDDVQSASTLTPTFLALAALSTVVAAFGLMRDSPAVIIGAMVMAPLLGPNVALALASILGDKRLAWHALRANLAGAGVAFLLAVIIGLGAGVDPSAKEVATRTNVGWMDIVIALAAGIAGSLAFTSGLAQSIVGVMVAVALLPPLVVCGLLLGAQEWLGAYKALLLVLINVTAVNLAGVGTFLVKGVRPASWWEKERATRASITAGGIWTFILALLVLALWLST